MPCVWPCVLLLQFTFGRLLLWAAALPRLWKPCVLDATSQVNPKACADISALVCSFQRPWGLCELQWPCSRSKGIHVVCVLLEHLACLWGRSQPCWGRCSVSLLGKPVVCTAVIGSTLLTASCQQLEIQALWWVPPVFATASGTKVFAVPRRCLLACCSC